VQDLPNEHEKIEQPTIKKGRANRRLAFAFTQRFALNVRMSRVAVRRRRSIVHRGDFVSTGFSESLPVKNDFETPEINAIENHFVRRHRNDMHLHVQTDVVEFRSKRFEIAKDVPDRRLRSNGRRSHRSSGDFKSV
jgi:hypothetical protein